LNDDRMFAADDDATAGGVAYDDFAGLPPFINEWRLAVTHVLNPGCRSHRLRAGAYNDLSCTA